MCWRGKVSAAAGFSGVAWAVYKKEPSSLWACLAYFSLIGALQAFTYTGIDAHFINEKITIILSKYKFGI
jgi:hypothetical protein